MIMVDLMGEDTDVEMFIKYLQVQLEDTMEISRFTSKRIKTVANRICHPRRFEIFE